MAFERITDDDMRGKGNLGRPDTPGVDTAEMQRILDELPREVIAPAFNRLAEQMEATSAASALGASPPEGLPEDTSATVQGVLEAVLARGEEHAARTDNPHGVTAAQTGAYTKEETDAAIGQRVVEIGTGDMAQAVYDPAGEKRDVFAAIRNAVADAGHMEKSVYAAKGQAGAVDRALSADTARAADDGVKVYVHSKSGAVHDFAGTGANGRALLTADVEEGDTFTVNGVPASAYMGAEEAVQVMAGSPWNGRWVSFVLDGETLNFKGGGGLSSADRAKLIPENIREGVTLFAGTPREVAGGLKAKSAVCIGAANTGDAIASYMLADDGFVTLSGGIVTVREAGAYRVLAYGMTWNTGAITYSARELTVTKGGEAIVVPFQESTYNGSAEWEGELDVGDTIHAKWSASQHNSIGSPSLAVSITKVFPADRAAG